jgi:aminoglycoside 3-N-acetyltransferase
MANTGLVRRIFSISPHIEMLARRLYWNNIGRLNGKVKRRKPRKGGTAIEQRKCIDFAALERQLRTYGVNPDSLLLLHSSFAPLKGRVSSADEVVDFLLDVVGEGGTLAMPAMALFRNARPVEEYLSIEADETVYIYDVQRSRIKTGALPAALHKRPGSIRSRHPINSMVALGPYANELMQGNLAGESPLACGVNSSWSRCVERDAMIVSIGTDLTHSLTMIHVAEDVKDQCWPVTDWYVEKHFHIKDRDFEETRLLRERAPRWGALHFAERTLCKDLMAAGLLKSNIVDGILVEAISAKSLIDFLDTRNQSGYPYFWLGL